MWNLDNCVSRFEATTGSRGAAMVQSFVVGARLGETEDQAIDWYRREHPDKRMTRCSSS
jgi:hypothetical protein